MKKQLVIIGLVTLLVCVGLSGCEDNPSDVIKVTVIATASTVSYNITKQNVRFDFEKTMGEPFTLYKGWLMLPEDYVGAITEYYAIAEVGYNIRPGDDITVSVYHPMATPTTQYQIFTYDQCRASAYYDQFGDGKVLIATIHPLFYLN